MSTHLDQVVTWARSVLSEALQEDSDGHHHSNRLAALLTKSRAADAARFDSLFDRFVLSESEQRVVWLLVAIATDLVVRRIVVSQSCDLHSETTGDLIMQLVYANEAGKGIAELGSGGVLRRSCLIERSDGGGPEVHESRQTWAISRRILAWLHGDTALDPTLARIVRIPDRIPALAMHDATIAAARDAMNAVRTVIVASGSPGVGRRSLLASTAGLNVLEVDAKRLAKDPAPQLRMIARECKLLGRVPLIRNIEAVDVDLVGTELVAELDTNILVTAGSRVQLRWDRPVIAIDMKPPTSAHRAALWRAQLTDATESDAEHLATQYPLAPALIHHAARAAQARATGRRVTPADIEAGIRAVLDDRLGAFARRVDVTQSWDDLVLAADQQQAIAELVARIRQRRTVYEQWGFAAKVGRGLGTSALFSGPPGTGKTMVAALIANELGLELYQVDMGKVVSKWIGETEKQLGELFDAAEAGHAILLFDEADSLFGKRTDVKSSNDRYANFETNYLLQRLESFTGICVLTSNHESNIDPAFQRRLSLHLRFEVPDEDEREQLWRAMLPAAAPVAEVDFAHLARRFEMTGGYIRNAALRAAFLAADEGTSITEAHLEHAARLEYEGMGKITTGWPPTLPTH
jgi:SpoVK/Ycf46/Vps4 family AAA+-type ATPase